MNKNQNRGSYLIDKLTWMPETLRKDIGQFNIFSLKDSGGKTVNCNIYNRKGYYKISLINGNTKLFYADQSLEIKKTGLLFSNPYVPYSWEHVGNEQSGVFCVFYDDFFNASVHIKDYPVFKLGNTPLFELSPEQADEINDIFSKMFEEIESDFTYKYDVLRNRVLELIFCALKMQPSTGKQYNESNASMRAASMFIELLERQFPIESPLQRMKLRFPLEFANQLGLHVNHLNKSLKKITGKTTSQLIAERIVQEARGLLKHTDWNISEIAWCLGFEEAPHFINFFKKNEILSPRVYRKIPIEQHPIL
ncbi:helix-turn-helix domain-containing protein [Pedobacter lithocola]|uniref:Helix-turn-helix domain-containing protein n=1 Tax=Pedobacter lithocola TaxID=1908239 RepID=A0ABV8PAZ6_9SPHI